MLLMRMMVVLVVLMVLEELVARPLLCPQSGIVPECKTGNLLHQNFAVSSMFRHTNWMAILTLLL